jgi:magnesium-transporting ATPase (P-type)
MSWNRWRRICGWLAVVSATAWAIKFILWAMIALTSSESGELADQPAPSVVAALIGFLLPTVGSVAALVAGSGLAAPLVRGRPLWLGIIAAIGSALVVSVAFGALSDAFQSTVLDQVESPLLMLEGTDLLSVVLEGSLALALLRPGRHASAGAPAPVQVHDSADP